MNLMEDPFNLTESIYTTVLTHQDDLEDLLEDLTTNTGMIQGGMRGQAGVKTRNKMNLLVRRQNPLTDTEDLLRSWQDLLIRKCLMKSWVGLQVDKNLLRDASDLQMMNMKDLAEEMRDLLIHVKQVPEVPIL